MTCCRRDRLIVAAPVRGPPRAPQAERRIYVHAYAMGQYVLALGLGRVPEPCLEYADDVTDRARLGLATNGSYAHALTRRRAGVFFPVASAGMAESLALPPSQTACYNRPKDSPSAHGTRVSPSSIEAAARMIRMYVSTAATKRLTFWRRHRGTTWQA